MGSIPSVGSISEHDAPCKEGETDARSDPPMIPKRPRRVARSYFERQAVTTAALEALEEAVRSSIVFGPGDQPAIPAADIEPVVEALAALDRLRST